MIIHFLAYISKWELVCKFGVIFHIFIISCLCSRFHVWNQWFLCSVITFSYTKCFVHSYTVDVVFTLSYIYDLFSTKTVHPWRAWDLDMIFSNNVARLIKSYWPKYYKGNTYNFVVIIYLLMAWSHQWLRYQLAHVQGRLCVVIYGLWDIACILTFVVLLVSVGKPFLIKRSHCIHECLLKVTFL